MKKKLLALCDPEKEFAGRFTDYFSRHRALPCELRVFTTTEALSAFARKATIDILLIHESLLTEEVSRLHTGSTVLLTDKGTPSAGRICKYQSAPAILQAALAACPGPPSGEDVPSLKPPARIVVVYSPISRCFKTTFALTLGQLLSRDHPTLCLSMEEDASLSILLHAEASETLADMIYRRRQKEKDFISGMAGAAVSLGPLEVLMPTPCPEELYTVAREEWDDFFSGIEEDGGYEYLVVDAGSGAGALQTLLMRADFIFLPLLTDGFSQAKLQAFRRRLTLWDIPGIEEKIHPLSIPVCRMPESADRFFERLTVMPLGDFTQEVIRSSGLTRPSDQASSSPMASGFKW